MPMLRRAHLLSSPSPLIGVGNLGFFTSWDGSVIKAFDLRKSIRALQANKAWNAGQLILTFVPRGPVDATTKQPVPLQPGVRAIIEQIGLMGR